MENKGRKTTKVNLVLRMAISAYLIYLVFDLRYAPMEYQGTSRIVIICAMVIFAIVGITLGINTFKRFKNGDYDED